MATNFQEMGDGEMPNYLLGISRFLFNFSVSMSEDNLTGEWPRLPPPASKEAVKNLPDVIIECENKNCPICLKNFSIGEKVTEMPCHHQFHAPCIMPWLQKTNSCPFCRHELPTDDKRYEAFKKVKKRAEQRKEEIKILHNSMFS